MNSILKVVNADLTSPWLGFQFEIGKKYTCPDFDPNPENECSDGFYATEIEGLTYAYRPGRRVFEVEVGGRNVNADPLYKRRWEKITLIREVLRSEIAARAKAHEPTCGYVLSEAIYPVCPLDLPQRTPTAQDIKLLMQWASVWASVSASVFDSVCDSVGDSVSASVCDSVFDSVCDSVGDSVFDSVSASVRASVSASVCDSVFDSVFDSVWASVSASVRASVSASVCDSVSASVWASVWASVSASVWAYFGSLFPGIKRWEYIEHAPGVYPFQPAVDLWRSGLIPVYDGRVWRLYSGKRAEVVWEEK